MADIINILVIASVYGLYASGFTLIFGVLDILNLAHASVFAFGAVFTMYVVHSTGLPLILSAGIGILGSTAVGVIIERIAFRPIRYRAKTVWGRHVGPLMTSLGAATMLTGLQRVWFGIDPRHFPHGTIPNIVFKFLGYRISLVDIVSISLLFLTFGAIWAILKYTRWGMEIRAVAERPETVPLFGIDIERRIIEVFALASALGGFAGLIWGMKFNHASPETAAIVDIRGFAIIILGGLGSIPGAFLGALFIAAAEVLSVRWLPSGWQFVVAFTMFFLMLVIRPQGILGRKLD